VYIGFFEKKRKYADLFATFVFKQKQKMSKNHQPIQHEAYFHVYNRGINGETLFREPENYKHFLRLYEKYIDPVAETFAWCLLKNHFHLLLRIKGVEEIDFLPSKSSNAGRSDRPCQVGSKQRTQGNPDLSGSLRPDRVSAIKKPSPERT
jgi:hypothetical protein